MNKNKRNILSKIISSLFLLVIGSSLLIKPLHLMFHQHQHDTITLISVHHKTLHQNTEKCPICEFEFCEYLPEKSTASPNPGNISFSTLPETLPVYIYCYEASTFQLRAPPHLA